jgi:hypothetical protein
MKLLDTLIVLLVVLALVSSASSCKDRGAVDCVLVHVLHQVVGERQYTDFHLALDHLAHHQQAVGASQMASLRALSCKHIPDLSVRNSCLEVLCLGTLNDAMNEDALLTENWHRMPLMERVLYLRARQRLVVLLASDHTSPQPLLVLPRLAMTALSIKRLLGWHIKLLSLPCVPPPLRLWSQVFNAVMTTTKAAEEEDDFWERRFVEAVEQTLKLWRPYRADLGVRSIIHVLIHQSASHVSDQPLWSEVHVLRVLGLLRDPLRLRCLSHAASDCAHLLYPKKFKRLVSNSIVRNNTPSPPSYHKPTVLIIESVRARMHILMDVDSMNLRISSIDSGVLPVAVFVQLHVAQLSMAAYAGIVLVKVASLDENAQNGHADNHSGHWRQLANDLEAHVRRIYARLDAYIPPPI